MLKELSVRSSERVQFVDVTAQVAAAVSEAEMRSGTVVLWVPHTTAAITVNENADPSVCSDMIQGLAEAAPAVQSFYRHAEGNSDAHIKSSLVGPSLTLIVEDGRLLLGTWQGIYFTEFDGPRTRRLHVKLQSDSA